MDYAILAVSLFIVILMYELVILNMFLSVRFFKTKQEFLLALIPFYKVWGYLRMRWKELE